MTSTQKQEPSGEAARIPTEVLSLTTGTEKGSLQQLSFYVSEKT